MPGKQLPHRDLVSKGLPGKGEVEQPKDQLAADMKKVKDLKSDLVGKIRSALFPVVPENIPAVVNVKFSIKDRFDPDLIKKLGRGLAVVLLLLVLFPIGSSIFKSVLKNGEQGDGGVPTPSVGPFRPYKPSIYADDEQVLQMEEDVKVLDRELSTSQLKDTVLTPPVLDFDISF